MWRSPTRAASLDRSIELAAILDRAQADDHVVETDGRSVTEVARAVLVAAGWWDGLRVASCEL